MHTLTGLVLAALLAGSGAPGKVTRAEYDRVREGMTRAQVERIFGAGPGCEYVRKRKGEAIGTGRQYRRTGGPGVVAITYVTRNGVTRVTGRQWNTWSMC